MDVVTCLINGDVKMKLIKLFDKIGVQPLHITQHTEAKVFVKNGDGTETVYTVTGMKYENGKMIGMNAK